MPQDNPHQTPFVIRFIGACTTMLIHGLFFIIIALSSGSSSTTPQPTSHKNAIFCRYIENGRLSQIEVQAADWQEAEERICGAKYRNVRLPPTLSRMGARILQPHTHPILLAQRESCSCSDNDNVPLLQDIGIVEAPRLGAETKKTALPRILNTPEPATENTVTTKKSHVTQKIDKPRKNTPSIDDLLNAASEFDEARPISDVDPGGSADGSRLSKSATGKGDPYLQKIKARLDNTMNAPASVPKSQLQKLSAKLWIRIGDNGKIWSWDFTRKSGNAAFDKMIEMTIKQFMMGGTQNFPQPPENWRLQTIPVLVDGKDIR